MTSVLPSGGAAANTLCAKIDTGHRGAIHDAQTDYYGQKLATCSSDRVVRLFKLDQTGQSYLIDELIGHEGPVWQVSWSHPSFESLLATCSYDKKVLVWKETALPGGTVKWAKVHEHAVHDASVNSVSWAPYQLGCMLACGSADRSLTVLRYDEQTGNWHHETVPSAHDDSVNAVTWCPPMGGGEDGFEARIASAGNDGLVKVWKRSNTGSWSLEAKLEGHEDWVRDVAWAPLPGGKMLLASCGQDRRVLLWWSTGGGGGGSALRWESRLLHTFGEPVWHLSWSMCASMLAVSAGDSQVTIWKESADGEWTCISDSSKTDKNAP